jgi:N-acetylglutamate synthase-like GNAT family acetyltransferase
VTHAVDLPGDWQVSDDPARLDVGAIHRFLSEESYWAQGRSREVVERSIAGSLCVGLYAPDGRLGGFARAVTDRVTFAWLSDVFVLPPARGAGRGKAMVAALLAHPDLAEVKRWVLRTRDAQGMYAAMGFATFADPERVMTRAAPRRDPLAGPDA